MTPISQALVSQLEAIAVDFAPPPVATLHIPGKTEPAAGGKRDAAFCAIELQDGAFGLSYLMLDDAQERLTANPRSVLAVGDPCPLALARRFASGGKKPIIPR